MSKRWKEANSLLKGDPSGMDNHTGSPHLDQSWMQFMKELELKRMEDEDKRQKAYEDRAEKQKKEFEDKLFAVYERVGGASYNG